MKRDKTDAADAEAICEAARRPTMRFVEIKSEDQQAVLAIHRARDLVVRQRTQVVNMIRSILREFGYILPTGIEAVSKFAREHGTEEQLDMPETADGIVGVMCHQLNGLNARVDGLTKLIEQHAWLDTNRRRLMHAGDWPDYGFSCRCHHRRCETVRDWTRLGRVAGPHTAQ